VQRTAVNLAIDYPARARGLNGALRASRCDRLRRPLTPWPLTRDRRLRGNGQEWASGPWLIRVRIN
jgi:hypothetical protein